MSLSKQGNKNIKAFNIFKHTILYTTYAYNTTFPLTDKGSSYRLWKSYESNCEGTGIVLLKWTYLTLCGTNVLTWD